MKTSKSKIQLGEKSTGRVQLADKFTNYKDFNDYLLSKGYSSKSSESFIRGAHNFNIWCEKENIPIELVNYSDILHYIQGIKERVQQSTASMYVNSIKHYFKYLKYTGEITENPVNQVQIKGIKRKKLYDILTKSELESLYHHFALPAEASAKAGKHQPSILAAKRNKVILGLMVYQGLTTTELTGLDEKGAKLRDGTIYIKSTRRSNERVMKLEAFQIMDLMEYMLKTRNELLKLSGKESTKLFISSGSSTKLQNTIQMLIDKLHKQNQKVTNIKQIRASVITHWLKRYNLRQVQYMAGHRFISSTEAYLINDIDDLQEDINKYHPIG